MAGGILMGFILAFVATTSIPNSWASESKIKRDLKRENQYLAQYINSFSSLQELLDDMQLYGFFTQSEKDGLIAEIKKLKVNPQQRPSRAQDMGEKIVFGKSAALIVDPKGQVKTHDGTFITVKKGQTLPEIFMQVANLQISRKTSSHHSAFLNVAIADDNGLIDAVTSGAGFVIKHVLGFYIGDFVVPGTVHVLGPIIADTMEHNIWPIRNWFQNGKVVCSNDRFVVNGFKMQNTLDSSKSEQKEFSSCDKRIKYRDTIEFIMYSHFDSLCRSTEAVTLYARNSFLKNRQGQYVVKESVLKEELGDSNVACTSESAKVLTDKLKSSLRQEMSQVLKGGDSQILHSKPIKNKQ